jgi:hypothetical protein
MSIKQQTDKKALVSPSAEYYLTIKTIKYLGVVMPVIPASQKAEAGGSQDQGHPDKINETLFKKHNTVGVVAQVVEHLPAGPRS